MNTPAKFNTVEEYLDSLPENVKSILEELRMAIRRAAPHAEDIISYNMPAVKFNEVLVYYAAFKNHIGFYPTASAVAAFKSELGSYKTSRGAIQFPTDKAIPLILIKKIVKFRVKEVAAKAKSKRDYTRGK